MSLPVLPDDPYEHYKTGYEHSHKHGRSLTNQEVNHTLELRGVKRVGRCHYKKCGAACCRILTRDTSPTESMPEGWAFLRRYEGQHIYVKEAPCSKLKKDMTCLVNKRKPVPCRYFPHVPTDMTYQAVKDVCGYRFVDAKTGKPVGPREFSTRKS